jgi:hypothetical protein
VLNKMKCLLAGHSWGEWRCLGFSPHRLERTCIRCHHTQTRYEFGHEWGAWEWMLPEMCVQRRICIQCPESETRYFHEPPFDKECAFEEGESFCNGDSFAREINTIQISTCPKCGTTVRSEIISCRYESRPAPNG